MKDLVLTPLSASSASFAADAALPIRVIVAMTFEIGRDTGDKPGEYQRWAAGRRPDEVMPLPTDDRNLHLNRRIAVLGIVIGEEPAQVAASIEALGNDARFDLPDVLQTPLGYARLEEADRKLDHAAALMDRAEARTPKPPRGSSEPRRAARAYGQGRSVAGRAEGGGTPQRALGPEQTLEKWRLLDRLGKHDDAFAVACR